MTKDAAMTSAEAIDRDDTDDEGQPTPPAWISAPAEHGRAPVWTEPVPRRGRGPAPVVWLLGAHGGAGVSTLERVWAPAGDSRHGWPAADTPPFVAVVARMHTTGLEAAHRVIMQHRAGATSGCTLLGLVTVAAGPGKPDVSLSRRRELVAAAAGQSWHIGWVPELLSTDPASLATWTPTYEAPARGRFSRPPSVTDAVAPDLADVGAELFQAAQTAWQSR